MAPRDDAAGSGGEHARAGGRGGHRAGTSQSASGQPPAAVTVARPRVWRSPRFLLGLLLVALAVVLGAWAVDRAAGGADMLVARADLVPGQRLTLAELDRVRMGWDGPGTTYLTELPPDAVVTGVVRAGELLPAAAVGSAADVTGHPMAVPLPTGAQVRAGQVVDLWVVAATRDSGQEQAEAALLSADVLVLGLESDTGPFRSGSGTVARVLVPQDVVPAVLEATAVGDTLMIVERAGG